MAVFDGGFTLEAAAEVCVGEDEDIDVEEVIVSLVDKSLLRPVTGDDGAPRFTRLRTIRDFSLDRLEESGEAEIWRRRHAEHFADLVEEADTTRTERPGAPETRVRIEREYENLRAALAWSLERDETELALRLCHLPGLWLLGGQFGEMRHLVERLPSLPFEDDVQRADAINMAGRFAQLLGDNSPEVVSRFEEALALYRAAGHRAGTARALMNLGNVRAREAAYEEARHLFREALPLYRELGDVFGESGALMNLGDSYLSEDDLDRAEEMFQEAQSAARGKGDRMAMSFALQYLGAVSYQRGDLDEAEARFRQALVVFEAFGARPGLAWTWYYLAMIARDRGSLAEARSLFLGVIESFNDYRPGIAVALLGLATLELREGRPEQAVQLIGTSRALRRGTRMTREAAEEMAEREVEEGGRESLGEAGYERALEEGERLSLERALEIGGDGARVIDDPAISL